jgi:hypothetical protein
MATEPLRSGDPAGFDPWTATVEDSLLLPLDLDDKRSLTWQYLAAQKIKEHRHDIERGTGFDVMVAMATCARHGLSTPAWLAERFVPRVDAVTSRLVDTWDAPEAFGCPLPTGSHLARMQLDLVAPLPIWFCVKKLLADDPKRALDNRLFGEVAVVLGVQRRGQRVPRRGLSRSECSRLYYEHKDEFERLFGTVPDPAGKS